MVQHENILVSRVCEAIPRRMEDDITQTPGLSPPSSPELEICPDKGMGYDDDDDDSFQECRSEPARGYKHQKEDQKSIDYFHHDFDAENNEFETTTSTTDRNIDSLHRSISSPLDLSAFAQQLYENRLSVLHPRQSKLILTDQDEAELERLMLRQRKKQQGYACEKIEVNDYDRNSLAKIEQPLRLSDVSSLTRCSIPHDEGSHKILVEEEEEAYEEPSSQESVQENDRQSYRQSDLKSTSTKSSASRSSRFKEIDMDLSDVATDIIGKQEPQPTPSRSMSLNIFGNLRNRARSHSSPSIKGLMRNLSTGSVMPQRPQKKRSHSTLSPAAMAVLKHTTTAPPPPEPDTKSKGKRMLSQLLASARISRKPTKKINMNEATRAQIVRRTIIYVPPDSENFMKHIEQPLIPRPVTPDSDEGASPRQQKATIVTRQTSVKRQISKHCHENGTTKQELEGVELREMSDGSVVWGVVKKQGRRKSFFAAESKVEYSAAHDSSSSDDDDEDEEQIEERVLALMGLRPDLLKSYPSSERLPPPPIPKRSPHRQQQATHVSSYSNRRDSSTTDIYYAPDATLPSLLQMISDSQQSPRENPTVEEQLDEVMRSLGYTDDQPL